MAENTGTWIDTKTTKVVHSEPEEGVLITAPGLEPEDNVQATIDRLQADHEARLDGGRSPEPKTAKGK